MLLIPEIAIFACLCVPSSNLRACTLPTARASCPLLLPLPHRLQELLPPLWRTEMPLVRVIVDMDQAGLGINEAILDTGAPPCCA